MNSVDTIVKLKLTVVSKNKITKNSMINVKLPMNEISLSGVVPNCKNFEDDSVISCSYYNENE